MTADVYRPAAIEQLKTLAGAGRASTSSRPTPAQKPVDIATRALDYARTHYHDVLIVDTAGRLAIDEAMMQEIARAARRGEADRDAVRRRRDAGPGRGQRRASAFNEALPLTGVVLTKLDGDARGGAALSVRHVTGKPIKFVGVGEKLDGLEPFHPERMASRILGMGDVLSLIEDAQQERRPRRRREKLAEKVKTGKGFDLEDFKQQIAQMKKMGGVAALVDKLPAQLAQMAQTAPELQDDKAIAPHRRHHQLDDAAGARASPSSSRPRASAASPPAPASRCRK